MVRVLVTDALIRERIHSSTHRHARIIHTRSHPHLVLSHDLWHACCELLLVVLLRLWLFLHILEHFIKSTNYIVGFRLDDCRSRLLLLLLLLLLHLLILHQLLLNAHSHGLLLHLLVHHGVVHLIGHHLLRHHVLLHGWLRLGHEGVVLGLSWRSIQHVQWVLSLGGLRLSWWLLLLLVGVAAAHHVEKVDVCGGRLLLGLLRGWDTTCGLRGSGLCLIDGLSGFLGVDTAGGLAGVDVAGVEGSVLDVFARHELLRSSALFDRSVSFESLVEVIIDDEAHRHDIFIVDLSNHIDQLWLELCQSSEQVIESV